MKAASALVVLVIGMGSCCLAEEDGDVGMEVVFSEQDVSCSQYCGGTYPEHTYPDSEAHSACTRGCRLAVMDALIAWPFESNTAACLATCEEAYGNGLHCFACKLGCNATTIDHKIPNRDHIYQPEANSNATNVGFVMEVYETVRDQLPQFILIGDDNMADLTEHAEKMYQLLPCSNAATFVFIEDNGESVDIRYGYDFVEGNPNEYEEEDGFYTSTYRLSCPWQYAVTGRAVFLVGVGLIAVALVACCCASLVPEEEEANEEKKKEHYSPMKLSEEQFYVPAHLKSPVIFSSGYPQPVPYYGEKKNTQF